MRDCNEITPSHFELIKGSVNLKDSRAVKELVAFLVVFGKPLLEEIGKESSKTDMQFLLKIWNIASDIGGVFSQKLKAFGCGGFETNGLTWNYLVGKYGENFAKSYVSLVDSLLIAYGISNYKRC